jgi:hypothetical protein
MSAAKNFELEGQLLQRYLNNVDVLNQIVQRHVVMLHTGVHRDKSNQQLLRQKTEYDKQMDVVREAHKRLTEQRQSHQN